MSKKLEFTYQGKDYCLQFTRKTVEMMEKNGFVASDISTKPMTVLPALFRGAFLANHRYEKTDTIDTIFACMKNKGELIGRLSDLYNEPFMALIDEPEETSEGNIDWTASW